MRMRTPPQLGSRDLTDVCSPLSGRGRWIARLATLAVALFSVLYGVPAAAFTFEDVALRARQLAEAPFKKPTSSLPKELQNLGYDQYRDIRFKPAGAYWRDGKLSFELQFFHQGWTLRAASQDQRSRWTGRARDQIRSDAL